jgi:hypothetical protein
LCFLSSSARLQVISLQDPSRLPPWMQDEVMVAENLSDTTERRKDWYHFYAAGGLPSLQRASLTQADVMELHFNRRAAWWCQMRISRMLFFLVNHKRGRYLSILTHPSNREPLTDSNCSVFGAFGMFSDLKSTYFRLQDLRCSEGFPC